MTFFEQNKRNAKKIPGRLTQSGPSDALLVLNRPKLIPRKNNF